LDDKLQAQERHKALKVLPEMIKTVIPVVFSNVEVAEFARSHAVKNDFLRQFYPNDGLFEFNGRMYNKSRNVNILSVDVATEYDKKTTPSAYNLMHFPNKNNHSSFCPTQYATSSSTIPRRKGHDSSSGSNKLQSSDDNPDYEIMNSASNEEKSNVRLEVPDSDGHSLEQIYAAALERLGHGDFVQACRAKMADSEEKKHCRKGTGYDFQ